jgi:hypothetical protein
MIINCIFYGITIYVVFVGIVLIKGHTVKGVLTAIAIVAILPLMYYWVNFFMLLKSFIPVANKDWLAFNGNIVGGLIGGLITIFGVWLTLKDANKKYHNDKNLSVRPYLRILKDKRERNILEFHCCCRLESESNR